MLQNPAAAYSDGRHDILHNDVMNASKMTFSFIKYAIIWTLFYILVRTIDTTERSLTVSRAPSLLHCCQSCSEVRSSLAVFITDLPTNKKQNVKMSENMRYLYPILLKSMNSNYCNSAHLNGMLHTLLSELCISIY